MHLVASRFRRNRLSAKDRRLAAIHEAGHVTMARQIGLPYVFAWLKKTSSTDIYEKQWIGHTQYVWPLILKGKKFRRDFSLFSVAGAVAECCWKYESFDDTIDSDQWFDTEAMSESDWKGCYCEPGKPSPLLLKIIKEVFSLFDRDAGQLWPCLLIEARSLMKDSD